MQSLGIDKRLPQKTALGPGRGQGLSLKPGFPLDHFVTCQSLAIVFLPAA